MSKITDKIDNKKKKEEDDECVSVSGNSHVFDWDMENPSFFSENLCE